MITTQQSGAFIETFEVAPTRSGTLDGLRFAVKDLIDVAGHVTGGGNPSWRDGHSPAVCHAMCVEQLLAAGARIVGKTITDELAFSLLGANHWYGTPLNPASPDRLPGGSSSGSASAVACELCDFALGTDTGGSVRVPASNCGILGYRPTHGRISVSGVIPLAPSFDTVGVFARDIDILTRVASVLLGRPSVATPNPRFVGLLRDAMQGADGDILLGLGRSIDHVRHHFADRFREVTLAQIVGNDDTSLPLWWETYGNVQPLETWSCLGTWIETNRPVFGPKMAPGFAFHAELDRVPLAFMGARLRAELADRWNTFLGDDGWLILPTTPMLAPLKSVEVRRGDGPRGYYGRTLSYTALAGVSRCPEVTLPLGKVLGVPIGLSLIGPHGRDMELLALAKVILTASASV